jgi:hypothetical protein
MSSGMHDAINLQRLPQILFATASSAGEIFQRLSSSMRGS